MALTSNSDSVTERSIGADVDEVFDEVLLAGGRELYELLPPPP
jgi:hypothetical protein